MAKYSSFGTTDIPRSLFILLAVAGISLALTDPRSVVASEGFPPVIHYTGDIPLEHLAGGDLPPLSLAFSLYDQPSSGRTLWTETQDVAVASDGSFHALLGSVVPFSTFQGGAEALFSEHQRWLGIRCQGWGRGRSQTANRFWKDAFWSHRTLSRRYGRHGGVLH